MTPHPAALEAWNRANFDPPTPELELEPAEMMQVEDEEERPIISLRFGLWLAVISAGAMVAHLAWLRAGMPTP